MIAVQRRASFPLTVLLLATALAGCGDDAVSVDSGSPAATDGAATVRILLTDAPSDYIEAASVDIGLVELISTDGEHVTLTDDATAGFVNLLDFQGPATTPIAEADIDPGSFTQMRLIIEAAQVELKAGYAFRDGSTVMDLKIPSGAQTGIKLNLEDAVSAGPLQIVPGETVLVLDFDVSRSFVLRGNPETPAGVHGVIFTPTIRVTGLDVAASIAGTVSTALQGVSIEGLTVRADPTDGGTVPGYQTKSATALTDAGGAYLLPFLVPGSYDVTVELPAGLGTQPEDRMVTLAHSENATGQDFEIIDITGSISGAVTTSLASATIAGLTVTATPQTPGGTPTTATTATDGTYLIDNLLPDTYVVTVAVGNDELSNPASRTVDVGKSQDVTAVDFEIIEDLTGSIAGTVSTALQGVSVEGLTVTATPSAQGQAAVTATTNASGDYLIPSLPAGTYAVTVAVGTGLTTNPDHVDVTLAADEVRTGVNFSVQ